MKTLKLKTPYIYVHTYIATCTVYIAAVALSCCVHSVLHSRIDYSYSTMDDSTQVQRSIVQSGISIAQLHLLSELHAGEDQGLRMYLLHKLQFQLHNFQLPVTQGTLSLHTLTFLIFSVITSAHRLSTFSRLGEDSAEQAKMVPQVGNTFFPHRDLGWPPPPDTRKHTDSELTSNNTTVNNTHQKVISTWRSLSTAHLVSSWQRKTSGL